MGMLKSISLENYKCFQKLMVEDKEELEIAPLTILCGVNSSGKSSILKSLLMLKQSHEDNSVSNCMLLNGQYIDNGTFNEVLADNAITKEFTISNTFIIEKNSGRTKDATSYRDLCRLYYDTHSISKFFIKYSITIIGGGDSLYSNKIKEIRISISPKSKIISTTSNIILSRVVKNKYTIVGENIPDVSGQLGDFVIPECTCYFSAMTLNSIYQDDMGNYTKLFIPAITSIFNIVSLQYSQIQYIAPLRENPKRRYIADKEVDYVGVTGENTPLLLKRMLKNDRRGFIAPENEDELSFSDKSRYVKNKFGYILNSWMKYLELGDITLDNRQKDLIKVKIGKHNIADVGFGVSQVIPILVEGIYMQQKQTLLLEQPEIHLHPKMQMRMADFLLSLSIQDKQVIVETHSDHIINRVVRRCMEDDSLKNKVKIYFIDKNESNLSYIESIQIHPIDGVICDNPNFFYQFASETEKIIDAGYKNMLKEQENNNV